ncbi:MAG: hypothetical protein EZS28_010431 [Streblomastix strix]|uniref:TmcB/TmcC TPR repeats domain-containing protein n=1 Tax=Streblomastix strix TaxID=222440 RepID=A0A5J4WHJ3_9EUKA|nr:MAG: hypothetical protein EZS28_010431 [Streblomastix strix]
MNEHIFVEDEDLFTKTEARLFSITFPLFNHPKKPNSFQPVFLWVIFCIQLVAIALFRIDNSTQAQTALSRVVNFIDLSSLSIILGKNSIFLVLGFLIMIILLFALLLICSFLFRTILAKQPWIITFNRILHNILIHILCIPIASVCITMIDCYNIIDTNEAGEEIITRVWRAASDNICMSHIYQIVGLILAIITFLILLVYCGTIDLLIYNFNPKNGGLLSCPDGFFNFIQHLFILSLIFILRYIYPWEFWRAVLSVGDSIIVITYITYKQPYYTLKSNFMAQIPWIIFGSVRLCAEIGYAFEKSFNSYIPQIVLIILSIIIIPFISYVVFTLTRKRMNNLWMLSLLDKPLITPKTQQNSKLKNPKLIEPGIRFIQYLKFRTPEMILYAEVIFTQAVRRHTKNANLLFQFWNFLLHYKKNYRKADAIHKLLMRSDKDLIVKFLIFSLNKEKELGIAFAQKYHQQAKEFTIKFYQQISNIDANYKNIYDYIQKIYYAEQRARIIYEELLAIQPHNILVLKQYASLLNDIYRDEESTEIVINRILKLEKDEQTKDIELIEDKIKDKQFKQVKDKETNKNLMGIAKDLILLKMLITKWFEGSYYSQLHCTYTPFFHQLQDAHLAPLFLSCLYQDLVCSFNYRGLDDGEAEFLISWDQICEQLLLLSDQITQTLENIYSIVKDASSWEVHNVVMQVFDIRLDLEETQYSQTQSSSKSFTSITHDEPIQHSNQEQKNSLIRALTNFAQKSREMASQPYRQQIGTGELPHKTNINFYSDIAYVCFNSIQPVFSACQKGFNI